MLPTPPRTRCVSYLRFLAICVEFEGGNWYDQAKRKEKLVKGMLQKQMMSVADQQQRLNKVRVELEKLEMVRCYKQKILLHFVNSCERP